MADFTMAAGTAATTITYDATGQRYQVNWDTKTCLTGACTLDQTKTYRLRVRVGLIDLGYADVVVASNGSALKNIETQDLIGLVNGRTLPVKFRIEQGAVSVAAAGASVPVGTTGGSLASGDGAASLTFPSGAVTQTTAITVSSTTGATDYAPTIELGPSGTQFSTPVTLQLPYDPGKLPPGILPRDLAVFTQVNGAWVEVPNTTIDEANATASVPISHFSTYTVLSRPNLFIGVTGATTLTVGQTTSVTAVLSYLTVTGTNCYPVYSYYNTGATWLRYQSGTSCASYSQPYTYPMVNYAVTWGSTDPTVASIPVGPTLTNASGVATSPSILAVSAGTVGIRGAAAGVNSTSIAITVQDPPSIGGGARGYVYSARDAANQSDLYYVNSNGTGKIRLTNDPASDFAPVVSPDGQQIAWQYGPGGSPLIRVMPLAGGAPHDIATCGYNHHPAWSPDGRMVAYNSNCAGGNGDIFVTRADGSGSAARLTTTPAPGGSGFPAWSPNGMSIAFMRTSSSPNNYQLWVVDVATRNAVQITTGPGDESEPSWSPDGRHIVYTCGSDLCIADYPSGTTHQLTTGGHRDFDPAWSPDGTRILFSRIEDLWVINADGSGTPTQLTSGPAAGGADWVRFSAPSPALLAPRGYVYSARDLANQSDLYYVNSDGSGLIRLTNDGASDFAPVVSYDGQQIAWQYGPGGSPLIRVMPLAGGAPHDIATCGYNHHPSWSPDSRMVAYNSNCLGGNGDLFVTRADGSGSATRLTNTPGPGGTGFPAWSPNGLYMAFMRTSSSPNNYQLWVLNLATLVETQLTTGPGDESEPTWSPDSRQIVYTCGSDLCIVDVSSGTIRQLTTGGHRDFDPAWSPDGTKILFSRVEELWITNADGTGTPLRLTSGPAAGGADWVRQVP